MSSSNWCLLTCIPFSQEAGKLVFLSLEEFSIICCDLHNQRFDVVNKAEVDVFLELSCFFCDPTDVGNLISGSSAFLRSSLNNWKSVHILLKPSLEYFEHYFAIMWDKCNCVVVWTSFGIAFLWDWNENWLLFPSCGHSWVFQICWHTECSILTASSFRIWNSSTGIPSLSLAPSPPQTVTILYC